MSAIMSRQVQLQPRTDEYLTLPSRYYTDKAVFKAEQAAIFARAWQVAGHISEIPEAGDFITVDHINEQLFFIRGDDGEIRGFHNVCRHRAHRLLDGRGNTGDIVCPYHAWRYDRSGNLKHARNSERVPCFDATAFSLATINVELFVGCIMYNLDADATPFEAEVAGLGDEIRAAAPWLDELMIDDAASGFTGGNTMACNWKVLVDNCVECYHCSSCHQDFVDLLVFDDYLITLHARHSSHTAVTENPHNTAYRWTPNEHDTRFFFWHVWPNITFGIFPGSPNFGVFSAVPIDVETTSPRGLRMRTKGAESEHDRKRREYVDNTLWPEDLGICESVQRGLKSRSYDQGLLFAQPPPGGHNEAVCHLFQSLTLNALTEYENE